MSEDDMLDDDMDVDDVDVENDTKNDDSDGTVVHSDSAASLAGKEEERRRIQAEIEAFIASGGQINAIPNNVVADPPKKPESKYGSQPI